MKKTSDKSTVRPEPSDELVRDYAQHLYEQNGRIPGRDLDNWLEAKACLEANIPRHRSHARLQNRPASAGPAEACEPPVEAHNLSS